MHLKMTKTAQLRVALFFCALILFCPRKTTAQAEKQEIFTVLYKAVQLIEFRVSTITKMK